MGSHHLPITGRTGLGGTGSPAQGVVGASCQGQWGAIFFREPGAPARGGRGVLPRGWSESPARPMGGHLLQGTGRTGPGGTGSPAQGVFGVSCQANGGPSSSENRAHRPGGDGESCLGGVWILLPGQWGAIFFREPGAPAWGGRGVLPRGCSESPARPVGGHLLQRTGRTGPGGTGSPAQGVFGVSCQANGGPSSLENRAHRPGGGRGVLPRGCSESPARPVGGHLLQWAMEILQCTAPLLGGSGQCNSCNALPHCPRAVGSGTPAMHYLTALGQWAVELLQCTASLPGGSGQCNLRNALPHCPGSVGSATPAIHCRTAWGQWAVQLLQCNASLPGGSGQCNSKILPRTASLPGGSGRCNFYNVRPHCLGAVGSATPAMHCLSALGAVGSGSPSMHCLTAWGQWAVQLLQCTASLPGGSGQWNSCNAPPQRLGAVGSATPAMHCLTALGAVDSGTPAMHCLTAWGQWAVELLQCTASLPGGSGQCNPCNAPPHCPGAVGSETPAMHCLTAWGQRAVELLRCTAPLPGGSGQRNSCNAPPHCPGGSGQCNSCNALPHCLGAVGSATPATHCRTAWGQWAAQLLQRTAALAWGQWAVDLRQYTAAMPGGSEQCSSCLVTWHQSKNPQDGSCRTDCLHALPRSTPIVNRRDSRATT